MSKIWYQIEHGSIEHNDWYKGVGSIIEALEEAIRTVDEINKLDKNNDYRVVKYECSKSTVYQVSKKVI